MYKVVHIYISKYYTWFQYSSYVHFAVKKVLLQHFSLSDIKMGDIISMITSLYCLFLDHKWLTYVNI